MAMQTIISAISTHKGWVASFESALRGAGPDSFELDKVGDCERCVLGTWLASASSGAALGDDRHRQLVALHREFHQEALAIAASLNLAGRNGDLDDRLQGLKSLSQAIVSLLTLALSRA